MDVLYLTYANNSVKPLPSLQTEVDNVLHALSFRANELHFRIQHDSFATVEKIVKTLTELKGDIVVFSFSGHAGRDSLELTGQKAKGTAIAQLLGGLCPNLKLVLLNGCSTRGQVKALLDAGVPAVIATSSKVEDAKATRFAKSFFSALANQCNMKDAFLVAKLTLEATDEQGFKIPDYVRHAELGDFFEKDPEAADWGLYTNANKESILGWKLPGLVVAGAGAGSDGAYSSPGEILIPILFDSLAEHKAKLVLELQQRQRFSNVPFEEKRRAVIESLPEPVAEYLRVLLMPMERTPDTTEKIFRNLIRLYAVLLEMLTYILLSQLWLHSKVKPLDLEKTQRDLIRRYLSTPSIDLDNFDYLGFIRTLRAALQANGAQLFVMELANLRALIENDTPFSRATEFLENWRKLLPLYASLNDTPGELGSLCLRGELELAAVFRELGFLARYKLTTVQKIDVLKFRHMLDATFYYGGYDLISGKTGQAIKPIEKTKVHLDNRSVLLFRFDDETFDDCLPLSPFIIDAKAFDVDIKSPDLSRLYLFSHYHRDTDACIFKDHKSPDDPKRQLSSKNTNVQQAKEQLDNFAQTIFNQPLETI